MCRQEEGVDGVADEAVTVGGGVRRLAHDAQHALVAVWGGRTKALGIRPGDLVNMSRQLICQQR